MEQRDHHILSARMKFWVAPARHVIVCVIPASTRHLIDTRGSHAANRFPHVEPRIFFDLRVFIKEEPQQEGRETLRTNDTKIAAIKLPRCP